jgi:protocatechuate 3,4-dioxygenase beta subunit
MTHPPATSTAAQDRGVEMHARDWTIHPPALAPAYKTSVTRSPRLPLVAAQSSLSETTGPAFGPGDLGPLDADLLRNWGDAGDPIGERMILHGRVVDADGRPQAGTLVEIWQANAGGRYRHVNDGYLAPLDPHFGGAGRAITDADGWYRFRTIKPGAYPWRNGPNSWRPAHIHLSLFGHRFAQRLITQLYFEGDPLIARCPIAGAIPDAGALDRLSARLDMEAGVPLDCLAWRFDVVLRGARQTWFENRPEGA